MKQRGRVACDQRGKPSFLETDSGKNAKRLGKYRGGMGESGREQMMTMQMPGWAVRSAKTGNHSC